MSSKLGTVCEQVLQAFYSQGLRTNTEWDEYSVAPFVYAARDKILHMFLETGHVGRNYGSGSPGQLGIDGFVLKTLDVSENAPFVASIPGEYADLKYEAGINIVPLTGARNPFRKIQYGYQWSGAEFMYAEGNIPYWVNPDRKIEFALNPGVKQIGALMVETSPDPGNTDLDSTLTYPPHLLTDIIREVLSLMTRQNPDQSVNNRDQKLG